MTEPEETSIAATARVETVNLKDEPSDAVTVVLPLRNSAEPATIVTVVSDKTGGFGESVDAFTVDVQPASSMEPSSLVTHKVRVQGLGPAQAARSSRAAANPDLTRLS